MFNPVLYVRKKPSGELELPLFARLMWLNSEKPGWRITSEKFSVAALEVPEGKDVATRYIAMGHVAVVDEQGRKVLSVPASAEIDSPYFAEDLFRAGAELALDILGFHVRNIPAEYWKQVEEVPREAPRKAVSQEVVRKEPVSKVDQEETVKIGPQDDVEVLFYNILNSNPTALGFTKNDLNGPPDMLLNKYCYKVTGLPWNLAGEEEKKGRQEMFRRIVFIVTMLMLIPTFANANTVLRVEGARAYLLGFLGGDGEIYSSSPAIRDDTLFTLRRMAYPLSTWSWVQAVIENSSVQGDVVTLTVSRPDIANFMNNSLPESVKEWKGYLSLTNVEVPIKKEEVKLKVNSLGEVDISKETLKYMLQAVEDDIIEALDWCAKNPKDAPSVYVLSLRAEARHGIVPLPEKIKSKIEETAKILEGGKK